MPHFSKTSAFFVSTLVLAVILGGAFWLAPAHAQSGEIALQIPLPGTTACTDPANAGKNCVQDLGEYILNFYRWFVTVAGVFAVAMLILAGFRWITAAGNTGKIQDSKDMLYGAYSGIVLIMLSFLLLQFINPSILSLRLPVQSIDRSDFFLGKVFCLDQEVEEDRSTLQCGDLATLKNVKTSGGAKQRCIFSDCPSGQICSVTDNDTGEFGCRSPEEACRKTSSRSCKKTDELFQTYGVASLTCRKRDITASIGPVKVGASDDCDANEPWTAFSPLSRDDIGISMFQFGYECSGSPRGARFSCNVGEGRGTPCWDGKGNRPKVKTDDTIRSGVPIQVRATCTDDLRANKSADAICCGLIGKKEIDCRQQGHDDEVAVPCEFYNTDESQKDQEYQSMEGGGDKTQCNFPNKCWMQLKLLSP